MNWRLKPSRAHLGKLVDLARQAAGNAPGLPQSWVTLFSLLNMLNRNRDALAAVDEGLEHCPDDPILMFLAAHGHRNLGEYEAALERADRVLRLSPGHPGARLLRFTLLVKTGQLDAAETCVADAAEIDPCEPFIFEHFGAHLSEPGGAETLLERCDAALAINPACANAVYFKALAVAKLGSPDGARGVLALDEYVELSTPAIPADYPGRDAFLAALADEILCHPSLAADPRGKATSGGQQTASLDEEDGPAIAALFGLIRGAIERYASGLETAAGAFTAASPANCSLNAWAVVLGPEGRQRPHRHPYAWLSGVFYVRAPKSERDGSYSGDLVLGALDPEIGIEPPWATRNIEPVPGRLVLFPSYTPHATTPSRVAGERISVAFDVIP